MMIENWKTRFGHHGLYKSRGTGVIASIVVLFTPSGEGH